MKKLRFYFILFGFSLTVLFTQNIYAADYSIASLTNGFYSSFIFTSMQITNSESLAKRIAEHFDISTYVRDRIIYENYSPVTNEQYYCENSQSARDILARSHIENGVVWAIAEYDPTGYYIVFGDVTLKNPAYMVSVTMHEMTHLVCAAKKLNQGSDEHSEFFKIYYNKIQEYVETSCQEFLQ